MLEWYAIREDFNKRKIVNYNVLSGWENEIKKARKNKKFNDYASLKEWLKREFMYYYWSKAEHEICVGGLFVKSTEELEKIDIYRQLEPNLDRITEYVIKEIGFRFKSKGDYRNG